MLCHQQDGGEGCEAFGKVAEPVAIGEFVFNDVIAEAGAPLLALEQHPQVFVECGAGNVFFQPGF